MDPIEVFASKAKRYARFRWTYAREAIEAIFDLTAIGLDAVVADIGAGTGILTKNFAGRVGQVYAVEPNPEMRRQAAQSLEAFPDCVLIDGRAEATTLPGSSVNLVTAAQASHWFEPEASRREFYRILKPGGWIAILRNDSKDKALAQALQPIFPPELDTGHLMVGKNRPKTEYFCGQDYEKMDFPFTTWVDRETFVGSLSTASYAPDEGSERYTAFIEKAHQVFDRFSQGGGIEMHGATELYIGRISCA